MILFYNKVYAYVCKIGEEKLGGCLWLCSRLGQKIKTICIVHADQVDLATTFC